MKKIIALIVVLGVVGGGAWLYMNFGNLVKTQAEKIASASLGVPVHIGAIDLDVSNKTVTVSGIRVANPKGFSSGDIMSVETVKIAADSLSRQKLVFNEIRVDGTKVKMEVKADGTNFSALKNGMPKSEVSQKQAGTNSEPVKVVIKRLLINNATLTAQSALLQKQPQPITLADISMTNIGVKQGFLQGLSGDALDQLKDQYGVGSAVVDKVKSDFKKAGDEVKGLMDGFMKQK